MWRYAWECFTFKLLNTRVHAGKLEFGTLTYCMRNILVVLKQIRDILTAECLA